MNRLARTHALLTTTNAIISETHAPLLARLGRRVALRFLNDLDSSRMNFIHVTSEHEIQAREILRRYYDKDFTLTDATSFVIMEQLGITHAFSFDSDFAQYGFTLLAAPDR